jgi:phenylalanyl-tRNA synthetase beta chain
MGFQISDFRFQNKIDLFIRKAKRGEKLKALDGNTYELDETMLVIADPKKPVAIAGVMGGEETGVTAATKNILLEAAIFDPVSVRKTSRKFGLRSESSTRFEKGTPWNYPEIAQVRAQELLEKYAEARMSGLAAESRPAPRAVVVQGNAASINHLLNIKLTPAKVKSTLSSLGFKVKGGLKFSVSVPDWRLDIKIPEDLTEEVGRIYGLNKLIPTMPRGELKLPVANPLRELSEAARDWLRGLGYDEVYNYSFYGRDALEKDGSSPTREPHAQVSNPINPNQELLRVNLTRNLLEAASKNARLFDAVKIFEIGKVFHPNPSLPPIKLRGGEVGLPHEETHLAMVCVIKGASEEEVWRKFKGDVAALIGKQVKHEFKQVDGGLDIYFDDTWVGWIGLLSEDRKLAWKIKDPCAVLEFNLGAVLKSPFYPLKYAPIPEFPPALRDIAFVVDEQVKYEAVEKVLRGADPEITKLELFDIYRGKSIGNDKKSLAFHLTLQSRQKTFSDQEIDAVMNKIKYALGEKLRAEIRV